ncbi:MAG TPA: PAS domain S-box protein, partial [Verrucomicrobiae bacterium]
MKTRMKNLPAEKNRRILVVDDNHAIHDDFRKILSPATKAAAALDVTEAELFGKAVPHGGMVQPIRYEIDSAYQGQDGVLLVKRALEAGRPYAMAFVDVRMPPRMDGVETTRKMWELDPGLQVVLCTAYSDYSWGEMFEKLGRHDGLLILKKPFDTVEALQLAQALTEKWRLHQQSRRQMEELEGMVATRTRELQQSNQALQAEVIGHQRAEETLRESEERFSGAFEYAPIGVALVTPDGRYFKVNRALCDLVGYSEAEMLTRTFQDITHPEDLEVDLENVRRLLAGEIRSYQMEKSYVHARGHLVAVLLNVSLIRDGQGQPRYFISQVQDITERRRAEEALATEQRLLSSLITATPDTIYFKDLESRFIKSSKTLASQFGVKSPEEILGKTDFDFFSEQHARPAYEDEQEI